MRSILAFVAAIVARRRVVAGARPSGAAANRAGGTFSTTRPSFYGSPDSIRVADNVLLYQNDNGGWPKNIDMARQLSDSREARAPPHAQSQRNDHRQRRDLDANPLPGPDARSHRRRSASPTPPTRGIDFLLEAQYPNGGWPMIYPLRKGYYSHITFNDGAMIGVMNVLRDVAQNRDTRRQEAVRIRRQQPPASAASRRSTRAST